MPHTIVVATNNQHKVIEIRDILAPLGFDVISAAQAGGMPDVMEDAGSFTGNAIKKAAETANALNRSVIADDSGLEVKALGGAPGILSARYACEGGNDGRNLAKLLANMKDVTDRSARFVCVIAVASPNRIVGTATGRVNGKIADAPRGTGGFGYDPAFIPDGYTLSFGELPPDIKNALSHRANALKAAIAAGLFNLL